MTPEVLRRLLGAHSNGIVANNPRDGHHRYPDPAVPSPSPTNLGSETRGEASTSTRHARLGINEVDQAVRVVPSLSVSTLCNHATVYINAACRCASVLIVALHNWSAHSCTFSGHSYQNQPRRHPQ